MTTPAYPKPLPTPTPTTQPFWDGLRAREVRIQRCSRIRVERAQRLHAAAQKQHFLALFGQRQAAVARETWRF